MESAVPHRRPVIEEVPYAAGKQCRTHLRFVMAVLEEHESELSDLDLQEVGKDAFNIAARIQRIMEIRGITTQPRDFR